MNGVARRLVLTQSQKETRKRLIVSVLWEIRKRGGGGGRREVVKQGLRAKESLC